MHRAKYRKLEARCNRLVECVARVVSTAAPNRTKQKCNVRGREQPQEPERAKRPARGVTACALTRLSLSAGS